MSQVEVSVVVPTRDRAKALDACLEALAAQSLHADRFEVIVADDGSREPVAPRLASWRTRIAISDVRTTGAGPAAARNAGSAAARGAYLAFTDDDCVPGPGWLQALLAALRRRPGALVGGRTINLLRGNPAPEASQLIADVAYDYYNADAEHARFFSSNNLACDAAVFRGLGGFDAAFRTSEDRDLCDRWRASERALVFAPDALVGHAHRMGLAGFIRQHVGYGRGAYRFMRAHRARAAGGSTLESGFYTGLLPRIARLIRGRQNQPTLWALLIVWQVANTAGFCLEWVAKRAARQAVSA